MALDRCATYTFTSHAMVTGGTFVTVVTAPVVVIRVFAFPCAGIAVTEGFARRVIRAFFVLPGFAITTGTGVVDRAWVAILAGRAVI